MKNFLVSIIVVNVVCRQWLFTTAETLLWNVTSDDDEVCMLMRMATDVKHPVYRTVSTIPENAILSTGSRLVSCPNDVAVFELSWSDKDFNWTFGLNFNATDSMYALTKIYGIVVNKSGSTELSKREWSYREHSYPEVSTSHSIECDYLWTQGGIFTDITWQPFAQNTEGDFGPGEECHKRRLTAGSGLGILIVTIIAIILALLVSIFAHRRRPTTMKTRAT